MLLKPDTGMTGNSLEDSFKIATVGFNLNSDCVFHMFDRRNLGKPHQNLTLEAKQHESHPLLLYDTDSSTFIVASRGSKQLKFLELDDSGDGGSFVRLFVCCQEESLDS